MVEIYASAGAAVPDIEKLLTNMGASITARNPRYRNGVIAAWAPIDNVEALAQSPGVSAVRLAHPPRTNAGATTTQGAAVMHSPLANLAGYDGRGITVGLLSDSWNISGLTPDAAADVATGDLPNTGLPDRPGLRFLIEGPQGNDEGRALGQTVYDIAPRASLCFATAFISETGFAENIRTLRTNPRCGADVIVDDVIYFDEPMFSDGQVAQAVDDVSAANTDLAGRPVSYFSSAGNQQKGAFSGPQVFVSKKDAYFLPGQGIRLGTIPEEVDTSGGFLNFTPGRAAATIAQPVTITDFGAGTIFILQWDDPFDLSPSGITTDLNLLFFDPSTGQYLFSSADDNFSTNQPIEGVAITGSGDLLVVIARSSKGKHLSRQVRYVVFDGGFAGAYTSSFTPATYGHTTARGASGVAADAYDILFRLQGPYFPYLEGYSSPGPVTIWFNADGSRRDTPEVRFKPDITAPDGGNTTFFIPGQDLDGDGFPNFTGTSASAPHAAGVAALMIQKAGGSGSISPSSVAAKLKLSAPPHDLDIYRSQALAQGGSISASLVAAGDDSNASSTDPNFFAITFSTGGQARTLNEVDIDLTPSLVNFDPSATTGLPLTAGNSSPGVTLTSAGPTSRTQQLVLTFTGFHAGATFRFGIDRDRIIANNGGNSADLLEGALVTFKFSSGLVLHGTFTNAYGAGYNAFEGWGLIDAVRALALIP